MSSPTGFEKSSSCLPACEELTLQEMFPTEERPEGMSEHSWNGILFTHHAEGCPELAKVIARGIELAEKHGWT